MAINPQMLGQSLEHWQALYIIALLVGALSTIAILVFAFHIKEAKFALKFSNYIYLIAAWLAVISTIMIISKSHSLNAEKDRELKTFEIQAKVKIKKATALAKAAEADEERLKIKRIKLTIRLHKLEREQFELTQMNMTNRLRITQLEKAAEPRVISISQRACIASFLRSFAGQEVKIEMYSARNEAYNFANMVADSFSKAGLKPQLITSIGASGQGFGIVAHDVKTAPPLAGAIQHAFGACGMKMGALLKPNLVPQGKFFVLIGGKPSPKN